MSVVLLSMQDQKALRFHQDQGFSKFTFKGPNRNFHQRQKVRNNCYYKTCFYKHAYYFI